MEEKTERKLKLYRFNVELTDAEREGVDRLKRLLHIRSYRRLLLQLTEGALHLAATGRWPGMGEPDPRQKKSTPRLESKKKVKNK